MTDSPRKPAIAVDREVRQLLAVVQELYASALAGTPEIWRNVYSQCSLLLESEAGGFISTDKTNQAADIASLIGFDQQSAIKAYQDYGVEADLLFMGTLPMIASSTFLGTQLIGPALYRSKFYDLLGGPAGVYYVFGGIVENDESHHSALYFWRRRDQPDFNARSQSILGLALPHIRQALEVQRRVRGPQLDAMPACALSLETFQNSRHGVFVLDDRGSVLFVNREGERIARSGEGITIRDGFLRAADSAVAAEIERLMHRATGVVRQTAFAPMKPLLIPRRPGSPAYEFLMIPVTDGQQRAILPARAAYVVTISDPANLGGLSHGELRRFGLTGAEARLCQALIRTGSLPQAADELHISWSTARSHLKKIFAKLGVSSQVQLVTRLVVGGPALPGNIP